MAYNDIKSIVALVALLIAGGIFGRRAYQLLWVNMRRGQPQPSSFFGHWGERIKSVVVFVGGQLRLFRFLVPGTSHFFIFWGFLILFPILFTMPNSSLLFLHLKKNLIINSIFLGVTPMLHHLLW